MSKIGKTPITLPTGVKIEETNGTVKITGAKGSLEYVLPKGVKIEEKEGKLFVTREDRVGGAIYGTTRANIANIIKGVSDGWKKELEIIGTGFRAEVRGKTLVLTVGYSHPVEYEAPEGIEFKVEKTIITVSGMDKIMVGQVAASIRAIREPEPYKGKGIKYTDEVIRRKVGKAAKAAGAA